MNLHSASVWRWSAALLLVVTAAIHIALVPQHLREAPYAGILFALLSASALALAGLLLTQDHPVLWPATGALMLTAIACFLISRSVGLPALGDDVGDWLNPPGVAAVGAEALVALICVQARAERVASQASNSVATIRSS